MIPMIKMTLDNIVTLCRLEVLNNEKFNEAQKEELIHQLSKTESLKFELHTMLFDVAKFDTIVRDFEKNFKKFGGDTKHLETQLAEVKSSMIFSAKKKGGE